MNRLVSIAVILVMLAASSGCLLADEQVPLVPKTDFRMTVADRFRIASGGVVITGMIESGTVSVGDSICILSDKAGAKTLTVTGIERFNKLLETASASDRVGLLVTGIERDAVSVGDRLMDSCD